MIQQQQKLKDEHDDGDAAAAAAAAAVVAEVAKAAAAAAAEAGDAASAEEAAAGWLLLRALRRLRIKAKESSGMSKCIGERSGAIALLAYILSSTWAALAAKEATLAALVHLPLGGLAAAGSSLRLAAGAGAMLRGSSKEAKINAAVLLERLATAASEQRDVKLALGSTEGTINGLVDLLGSGTDRARRAALRALLALCTPRRNRVRAVESGAVATLVEMLGAGESSDTALAMLELLCKCAEGRAAAASDPRAVEVIAARMNMKMDAASQCALRLLCCLCEKSPECEKVHRRLVNAGVFSKLMILLQMEFACGSGNHNSSSSSSSANLLRLLCSIREHCPDVAVEDRIIYSARSR